jgi:uncharacterized membrane protein YbaN (DUF454 family)
MKFPKVSFNPLFVMYLCVQKHIIKWQEGGATTKQRKKNILKIKTKRFKIAQMLFRQT